MIGVTKHGRLFALIEDGELLAIVAYRKGAERLKARLEELLLAIHERDRYIRDLEKRRASQSRTRRKPKATVRKTSE